MSKAKVGDLIRIINALDDEPYENGDIFEVVELTSYYGDVYGVNPQYIDRWYIEEDEYEIYRKQAHQAQVGDLIRITNVRDEITAYKLGSIYEVTSLDCGNYNQIVINGENGQSGYVFADEYVVHRKAGEESAEQRCNNCGKQGVHTCRGAEYYAEQDVVNHPNHYTQGRVEVIDIIEDAVQGADPFEAVCQANILKYTLRYRAKNGVEDLRKSVWYANRLIDYLDAKSTQ